MKGHWWNTSKWKWMMLAAWVVAVVVYQFVVAPYLNSHGISTSDYPRPE